MCNCPEHTAFIIEAGVCYWCPNCQQRFAIEEMPGYGKPKAKKTSSNSTPTSGTASVRASKPRSVSFAISGVLPSGKSKVGFASEMERHGHTWNKNFTGGTQVLICEKNRVNNESAKERKAKSRGIPIVTEKEFLEDYC